MVHINVAELMGKHKINQKTLADLTGIQPNTVSKLWHGKIKRLDIDHIDQLCKVFNCQPGDLLAYEPDNE